VYWGDSPSEQAIAPPHRTDGALGPARIAGAQRSAGRARGGTSASQARGFAALGTVPGGLQATAVRAERRIATWHLGTLVSRKRPLHPGATGISRRFTISMPSHRAPDFLPCQLDIQCYPEAAVARVSRVAAIHPRVQRQNDDTSANGRSDRALNP